MEKHLFDEYFLRNWRNEDAAALAAHANNLKIWRHLRDGFPHPYKLQNALEFISRMSNFDPPTAFAVATKKEVIGSIGVRPGKDVHRFSAELGYWLAESYWGRGIMPHAVAAMIEYGFETLHLHRIYAEPYARNSASIRVLEKAGLTWEGTLRQNVYKEGRFIDQEIYAHINPRPAAGR